MKVFSEQTGISVVYDHRVVRGRRAPAISGELSAGDALSALLDGSPLEYREIDGRTMAITRRAPAVATIPAFPDLALINPPTKPRVDEIIVTASYRAPGVHAGLRVDYSLDQEALELSGSQNVSEPIHDLPTTVASVSSANTQLQISAGGLNLTDLRGFGPGRSLLLVNGRRFIRTSGGVGVYGVDLNNLPTAFIDRVEVIHQGAGPVLGTEAVAGAVNVVMRDHVNGISLSADGGISERGDAGEFTFSLFSGAGFDDDRGNISAGVSYASDPSLFFTDRDYLAEPYGFALNGLLSTPDVGVFTPGFGGSFFTPAGSVSGAVNADGRVIPFFGGAGQLRLTDGGFELFEGRPDQTYNWLTGFSALPEIDRLHGYAKADYEASPSLSFYGELLFADTETVSQVAPAPITLTRGASVMFGDAIVVPADHPNAPAGLRAAVEDRVGAPIESFLIDRRFVELGPRRRDISRQSFQFSAGLKAALNDDWIVDAAYQYGRNRTDDTSSGIANGDRVALAVNPTLCAATPGCVPLNVFAGESVPAATADFYRIEARRRRLVTSEHVARVVASGSLYLLDDREGRVDVGGEYRRDALQDGPPPNYVDTIALAEFEANKLDASVSYGEAFAALDLPLTSSTFPLGTFDGGVDFRLTRWSGDGFVANIAGDLSWRPAPGLEFYAYALKGGRAPNVVELFSVGPNFALALSDPCAEPASQTVSDNCSTPGPLATPAGFQQATPLVRIESTGNPNLDAEDVHSRHFGVAIDFQELFEMGDDALRLTADWRFNRIDNVIDFKDRTASLADCYESPNLSSFFCGVNPATRNLFLERDPGTGALTKIEATYLNGGRMESSGLDATLAYRADLAWAPLAPALSVDVLYSYTNKMIVRNIYDDAPFDEAGLANFPRHQIYATGSLETDRFKTLWTVRRRGEAQTIAGSEIPESRLPPTTYVDVGLQFRPSDSVILYAGVENLFDKDLPVAAFAEGGFLAAFYDPIGRRYFAGAKMEF